MSFMYNMDSMQTIVKKIPEPFNFTAAIIEIKGKEWKRKGVSNIHVEVSLFD